MGNQAGIIIRNVKNELFHSAKRLILNEVKGIECLQQEFLIDAACYHGSSGSPVILLNNGSYTNKYGDTFFGASRVYLLGILSQGPLETIYGEIEVKDQPEIKSPIQAKVKIPTNLGLVIKSSRILELEEVIRKTMPVLDK